MNQKPEQKKMSPAALSMQVYGIYMMFLAIFFLLIPDQILPILGFETNVAAHPWVQVSAALIIAVGYYYHVIARHELIPMMRATIHGRLGITILYAVMVLIEDIPWELMLMAVPDVFSSIWTHLALKRSNKPTG